MDLFTSCIIVAHDMSVAVKRYREEQMSVVKSDVPMAMKILLPTREGTSRFMWHMAKSDDYKKIRNPEFSHWVNETEDGTYELVIVKNKTNEWEFYPIILMNST